MTNTNQARIYLILFVAILIVSTSSILIRWADDVPAAVLAFYRLLISGLILLIINRVMINAHPGNKLRWHWHYLLAGIFLALHFITWIAALKFTTIANAIFLGTTHPFFAVILSIVALKESPGGNLIPVFILCLLGISIIVIRDVGFSADNLTGDILALFSALFFALYILIVRLHRDTIKIIGYLGTVYTIAALVCLLFILAGGEPMSGFSGRSWLMILLLALGPSLLGHSLLNRTSQYLEIYKVNLAMLLEPVLGTIAGMLIFREFPGINFYIGATILLIAISMLVYRERSTDLQE